MCGNRCTNFDGAIVWISNSNPRGEMSILLNKCPRIMSYKKKKKLIKSIQPAEKKVVYF